MKIICLLTTSFSCSKDLHLSKGRIHIWLNFHSFRGNQIGNKAISLQTKKVLLYSNALFRDKTFFSE